MSKIPNFLPQLFYFYTTPFNFYNYKKLKTYSRFMPKRGLLQAILIHKNLQNSISSNISSPGYRTS